MNKQQRLRNTAEGFMAALVEYGFRGPIRWSNLDWELPSMQAWDNWAPAARSPKDFPNFQIGWHGTSSTPRELLWQLKRAFDADSVGMTPREYLQVWAKGASPHEWVELA